MFFFLGALPVFGMDTGFREISTKKYGEDTIHKYKHEKIGTEVIWIENKDSIKSFILGVKTPAQDSSGVNHIIEHTIFTGSKKYPSASLFFDASQMYPATYINALTSGDMTMYPFATPYQSCFDRLLDVYLDSIFHPDFLTQSNGFYEESFHYNPSTNGLGGVVYNEMKGVYASTERALYRAIREVILKGTYYANDSGGDPNEIPKLTYEDFKKTYQKYYYPGNMKVVISGNLKIEPVLEKLQTYYSIYENNKEEISLAMKMPAISKYEKFSTLTKGDKHTVLKNIIITHPLTTKERIQLDLWVEAYLAHPNSLLRQQARNAGIDDLRIIKDDDLPITIYTVIAQNIDKEKVEQVGMQLDAFIDQAKILLYREESKEKQVVLQSKLDQAIGEQDTQKGLLIGQSILDAWAHEKEWDQYFIGQAYLEHIDRLDKEGLSNILEKAETSTIELVPTEITFKDPLSLTSIPKEKWQEILRKMQQWQQQNQEAHLEPVPLEDFILIPEEKTVVKQQDSYKISYSPIKEPLIRSQLYFDTSCIPKEKLPYLFLYSYLLTASAREQVPFEGILDAKCITMTTENNYIPYLKISMLSHEEERNHYDSWNNARKDLLEKDNEWYKNQLKQLLIIGRQGWESNVLGALGSMTVGKEQGANRYHYEQGEPLLELCEKLLQTQDVTWITQVKQIDDRVYHKENLLVGLTGNNRNMKKIAKEWEKALHLLPSIKKKATPYLFEEIASTHIYKIKGGVDYTMLQWEMTPNHLDGLDYLTATYLTKHYLTPIIRVQKGAYGAGCQIGSGNSMALYTYRDPDYVSTLPILKNAGNFLVHQTEETKLEKSKPQALSKVHQMFQLIGSEMEKADRWEQNILTDIDSACIRHLQYQIKDANKKQMQKRGERLQQLIEKAAVGIATQKEVFFSTKVQQHTTP